MSDDHWFSKFFLRRFVVDGRVWVYDKTARRRLRKPIKNICCEEGFTTFTDDQIPPNLKGNGRFLEAELSKWETQQSQTMLKLVKERSIQKISPEEFWELVRFAVWLYLCNPAIRQMLRKGWSEIHLKKVRSYNGMDLDDLSVKCFGLLLPHAFLRKHLDSAVGQMQLLQSEFLDLVLGEADTLFRFVKEHYAWRLDDYEGSGFLLCTSDRPVLLGTDKLDGHVGFRMPEATLHFPLSPDLCLEGKHVGKAHSFVQPHNKVSDPVLSTLNQALMVTKSFNLIIASDPTILPPDGSELPSYIPKIIDLGDKLMMVMR